jgi:hypothetical protein
MFAFDNDDVQTMYNTKGLFPEQQFKFLSYPRYGYVNLHLYINSLVLHSTGDWLWLWNDDAQCVTNGWDEVLLDYDHTKPICISPKTANQHWECLFPIISRKWTDVVGHFSLNSHNDTWVELVAKECGIFHLENRIEVFHDREDVTGNNKDETRADVVNDINNEGDLFYRMDKERKADVDKIKQFLSQC